VLVVGGMTGEPIEGAVDFDGALAAASPQFVMAATRPGDTALIHFTSGTTGKPKGAVHVHEAVVAHRITGQYALDLGPDDIFWCTADPGWVTGTSYGIIAPLTNGVTMIVDEAEFDAERWYRILQEQRVTVWYTAPTAIRMLMKLGEELPRKFDLSRLRFMASVGEPLNPEAVVWSARAFGMPFHDNWWQTETGGIMIANYASMDVKPGSMGKPLPGITAGIVQRDAAGQVEEITAPMAMGELALRPGWPSMFRAYLNEQARYDKCFAGGWYLTGDLAMRDSDGYYWFVGRSDDVIKSAGHLIGPFEVESALMEHPAVAEVGVIGKPDPMAGEVVKAFVALKPGFTADEAMRKQLLGHARIKLGPAIAPREIDFRDNLPKTRSGKIMRRLLKARELGLPEGDLSTLESDEKK
jgi:acetyl-CoA synthetase